MSDFKFNVDLYVVFFDTEHELQTLNHSCTRVYFAAHNRGPLSFVLLSFFSTLHSLLRLSS